MNKKVFGRKLSRSRPAREALFATLVRSMVINGKIVTTKAKAKAVIGEIEKMITLAKKGTLASRREVLGRLDNSKDAVEAIFKKVVPAFPTRTSGYVRLVSLPTRKGDNAKMMRMEWTEKIVEEIKPKVEKVKKVKVVKAKVEKKTIKKETK